MTEQIGVCAYAKDELSIFLTYLQLKELGESELEVWLIERDSYGNFFVILTRHEKPHRGRKPKLLKLVNRVDVEHPIMMFNEYKEIEK